MKKHILTLDHLHAATLKVARFHFLYVLLYIAQSIAFHASKVITPELLLQRWIAVASLSVVVIGVWLIAKTRHSSANLSRAAIGAVIVADLAFAAFNVYTQRGYASKSVFLFVIPVIVAAVLINRSVLFAAALLAIATYTTTVVTYFVRNFNEGYMAEMYAEIGFYSGLLVLTAGLLWATMHKHR